MNQVPALPGNMDVDPLSSYEYSAYGSYTAQPYPYANKLQQSIYQAYQQTSANYMNNAPPQEPFNNPPALPTQQAQQTTDVVQPKTEQPEQKPVLKRCRKEKNGQKSTYCSEKITDASFKFYGCSVCNISYDALHELDQHVTVHKNRMTSYRLRLRNQIKKKQMKKEKKKLKKMVKIKKEVCEIEIKPEDGYIGEEKAVDFMSNGTSLNKELSETVTNEIVPNADCNRIDLNSECNSKVMNTENSATEAQNIQIDTNNDLNLMNTDSQDSQSTSLSTGNSEVENANNVNGKDKENSMDEAELNNLEKIYKCFACQKQFTLSYYLKLHVRSHTDEKPYVCSACGQSFITASKLGRHNKRVHLAERYQCRVCFKIYSRFEVLTAHFDKTHPEDKLEGEPYDYNAILPYLNELEEQLRAPPEQDSTSAPACKLEQDSKPKAEELFWEVAVGPHQLSAPPGDEPVGIKEEVSVLFWEVAVGPHQLSAPPGDEPVGIKEEVLDEDQKDFVQKIDILVEEVKVDYDGTFKREMSDDDAAPEALDEGGHGSDAGEGGAGPGGGGPGGGGPGGGDPGAGPVGDGPHVKDEDSLSDEDYFPPTTWTAPRAPSPSLPRPAPERSPRARPALVCELCHKRVSSASYMRVHLRTHTGERPFKCYKCGRGFITSSKMHRHVLTHAQDKDDVKTEGEDTKPELGDEATDQPPEGDAKLPAKKKSKMKSKSKSKPALKPGEDKPRRKHQKRPHACEYCNQKFLHLHMLEVHKQSHAGEALVLRCHFCLQDAPDQRALQEHQASHTGPKPYLCTVCGNSYKKRETMMYHRKRHSPDKEFVCDICSKRFTAACKLSKHLMTHRADRFVLRYECPVCAHMFNTQYHVHMHLRTHQKEGLILEENRSEILAMVLQNARKIPKQASAPLSAAAVPPDERSRVCNICGELFHHFYYLEEHLKSHASTIAITDMDKEDEKKYICEICNKGFKLHYYLKLHSFTHSKEKPFICQQCGKGFITKGKLKRHLETHTGLKKYQCHICYKFFTRPSYLRIHIRTIHGTQDYNFRFDKGYGVGSMSMSDVSQNSM